MAPQVKVQPSGHTLPDVSAPYTENATVPRCSNFRQLLFFALLRALRGLRVNRCAFGTRRLAGSTQVLAKGAKSREGREEQLL
jgi:hypothetical protein